MGASVRPLDPVAEYERRYLKKQDTTPADAVSSYLAKYGPQTSGSYGRAALDVAKGVGRFAAGAISAPIESAVNMIAPTKEAAAEVDADPQFHEAMIARFGSDIHPKGVTGKERAFGALQTAANVLAPGIARMRFGSVPVGVPAAGAAVGAAYNPEHPLAGAAVGAGLGSAIHAAVPIASGVAGKALDVTGARPESYTAPPTSAVKALGRKAAQKVGIQSAEQRAMGMLVDAIKADKGLTIEQAIQRVSSQTGQKPETLMDLFGANVIGKARGASMVPGSTAKQSIPARLQERAMGQEERLVSDLLQTSGQPGRTNIPRTMAALHEEARTAAQPGYDALRGQGEKDMSAAMPFFNRPAFQTAYKHAEQIAANEGKALPSLEELQKSGTMNFETADRVKRALDEVLYDSERPMPSELALKAGGISNTGRAAIERAKNDFLAVADQAFPGYDKARAAYAGPTALNRAVEKGKKVLTMSPDEIGEYVSTLSPSELASFQRSGLETFIEKRMESIAPGNDATRAMEKTIIQRRLEKLFPDKASFERFRELAGREAIMNQTRNKIVGQSATADKSAELADVLGFDLGALANVAMGKVGKAGAKILSAMTTKGAENTARSTANALGERVTAGAPGAERSLPDVLEELQRFQNTRAARAMKRSGKTQAAAQGATIGTEKYKR